jgi:hypothetical protein
VTASDELRRELVHDAFGPTVRQWRHALERRRDLRDTQSPGSRTHGSTSGIPGAAPARGRAARES